MVKLSEAAKVTQAMYGMSIADVADLYGAPTSDIARIVSP